MDQLLQVTEPAADPSRPALHLARWSDEVVARLLLRVTTSRSLGELGYLDAHRADLQTRSGHTDAEAVLRWAEQQRVGSEAAPGHLPLRALQQRHGSTAVRILVLAGLVEEDPRVGALLAALQDPVPGRRPSVGAASWLVADEQSDGAASAARLIEGGWLAVGNPDDPRVEWLLRVPPVLWDVATGRGPAPGGVLAIQSAASFPPADALVGPTEIRDRMTALGDLMRSDDEVAVVVRGPSGVGRRTVLGTGAALAGRDTLLVNGVRPDSPSWPLIGALATFTGAVPVLRTSPSPGETATLPRLPGYSGTIGITAGRAGGLDGPLLERALALTLPMPGAAGRLVLWRSVLPELGNEVGRVAREFAVVPGAIDRTAKAARAAARLERRRRLTAADVGRATRLIGRQALDTLASHLEPGGDWDDLVLNPLASRDLAELETRCRHREDLMSAASPALAASLNRGVRALFSGPSGTGKTMAARTLAGRLEADIYRVDLSAVVNKYIGETERNLDLLFSRAEELDVVLLLDEGDAIMARRTDVHNANDRYANLETNFLLQRLEDYEGIVLITTNAAQRLDSAFARRLDVTVEFAPPGPEQRLEIWRRHLAASADVQSDYLHQVAVRCEFTGAQIRNAALYATMLALASGRPVTDTDVHAGAQRETRRSRLGGGVPPAPGPE